MNNKALFSESSQGTRHRQPLHHRKEFQVDEQEDQEAREKVREDVHSSAIKNFAVLARYGLHVNLDPDSLDLGSPNRRRPNPTDYEIEGEASKTSLHGSISPARQPQGGAGSRRSSAAGSPSTNLRNKWIRGVAKIEGSVAARKLREAARLKALQRTPYPMVLARLKLLLERMEVLLREENELLSGSKTSLFNKNSMAFRAVSFGLCNATWSPPPDAGSNRLGSPSRGGSMKSPEPGALHHNTSMQSRCGDEDIPQIAKVREELGITFLYVSDFLRKVPDETRVACIDYARMENYKKDQHVYLIGDTPTKFYMILTGAVEIWAHPTGEPRKKTVLANLKRGQNFGEKDILNMELRTECVTPTSNCTFLVLDAEPFKEVFGDYFEGMLARAQDFFMHHVEMFRHVPADEGNAIVRHMLHTCYPPGRDWEPATEQQIYFIKRGTASLESHDKRSSAVSITRAMLNIGDGPTTEFESPPISDTGVLANVVLREGRAIGTLGHEEEIRRLKRLLIPKKMIATLGVGSHFGGGPAIMGVGEAQASLRVLSSSDIEVYNCHMEVFMKYASPTILQALRDDAAFKLTYFHGRVGMLGPETVVGHNKSLLAECLAKPKDKDGGDGGPPITSNHHHVGGGLGAAANNASSGPGQTPQAARPVKKKRAQRYTHTPGQYSPEVEKALHYIQALQAHSQVIKAGAQDCVARAKMNAGHQEEAAGVLPVPGYMDYLVQQGTTPAERFWSMPTLCTNNPRSAALVPLLKQVFPDGLGPLADKLDNLIVRTKHRAKEVGADLDAPLFHQEAAKHRHRRQSCQDTHECCQSSSVPDDNGITHAAPHRQPPTHTTTDSRRVSAATGLGGESTRRSVIPSMHASITQGLSEAVCNKLSRWGEVSRPATAPAPGAIIAAGLVWAKEQQVSSSPALRQVLTYEEVARLKAELFK